MIEQTLSIIKPDAVQDGNIGQILSRFEKAGLQILSTKMKHLSVDEACEFYAVHQGKPFYDDLVKFISSGPIFIQVLSGENAIKVNRDIMGATNPKDAAPGTIRADFAESIDANAVHGSDSKETALEEISFFFDDDEIL